MPRRGVGGKGDLFLRFSVRFPTHPLSAEAAKMLKQLLPRSVGTGGAAPREGERVYKLETVSQGSGGEDAADGEWAEY